MDDNCGAGEAKLPAFIRSHLEDILLAWEQFAKSILSARHMDPAALRDHAGGMLLAIADDLECTQTARQQADKARGRAPPHVLESAAERHGASRVASGFSVDDAIS